MYRSFSLTSGHPVCIPYGQVDMTFIHSSFDSILHEGLLLLVALLSLMSPQNVWWENRFGLNAPASETRPLMEKSVLRWIITKKNVFQHPLPLSKDSFSRKIIKPKLRGKNVSSSFD